MIYLYTGTPGSGKSLHMARDIYDTCNTKKGDRLIIVNFPVNVDLLRNPERVVYIPYEELTPNKIIEVVRGFWGGRTPKEGCVKLFIDESQLIFNSRDWKDVGRRGWISLFTQHRKLGLDIFLVAQFDEMIDKQMRALVEYHVIHRKVTNFGLFGFLIRVMTMGQLFIAIYQWYGIKERISYEYFKARKKYYSLYDTLSIFDENIEIRGEEEGAI